MYQTEDQTDASDMPFPVIRGLLRHQQTVTLVGPVVIAVLIAWLGYSLGVYELYVIAIVLGLFAYGALKVAIEVVALVAETLMPR